MLEQRLARFEGGEQGGHKLARGLLPVETHSLHVIADRGFGFIVAEDAKEYFFHRGGLEATLDFDRLVGGERVEFEIEQSPKGPRAVKVRAA